MAFARFSCIAPGCHSSTVVKMRLPSSPQPILLKTLMQKSDPLSKGRTQASVRQGRAPDSVGGWGTARRVGAEVCLATYLGMLLSHGPHNPV